jgi:hypothetical protein
MQSVILSLSQDQFGCLFIPSFPNSIWERNCLRNSVAQPLYPDPEGMAENEPVVERSDTTGNR